MHACSPASQSSPRSVLLLSQHIALHALPLASVCSLFNGIRQFADAALVICCFGCSYREKIRYQEETLQRLPTQAAWSCAQQQHQLLLQQQREWQQQHEQQRRQQELQLAAKTRRVEELEKVRARFGGLLLLHRFARSIAIAAAVLMTAPHGGIVLLQLSLVSPMLLLLRLLILLTGAFASSRSRLFCLIPSTFHGYSIKFCLQLPRIVLMLNAGTALALILFCVFICLLWSKFFCIQSFFLFL